MRARNVWAEVDLSAVAHNVEETRKKIEKQVKICAVVKADAYGHGAVPVANAALEAGAEYLAVSMTQEAIELREAGITAPILILGGLTPEHEKAIVDYNITQTVFEMKSVEALSKAAVEAHKTVKVHLAVDTGMNRIGCHPSEAGDLAKAIIALPNIELEGMFSHFATADAADKAYSMQQIAAFKEAIQSVEEAGVDIPLKHLDNSAGITELPDVHYNMVRQGITLYGHWPSKEVKECMNLQPVMKLKAEIVLVKEVPVGEKISYGCTFETKRVSKIATLPLGYADGLSRKLSNKGYIYIKGYHAPIVGRVCMDQIMVDVTDIPNVEVGDEAIIFGGKEMPLEIIADWMGTISYEVLCLLSTRIPRKYSYQYNIKHYDVKKD